MESSVAPTPPRALVTPVLVGLNVLVFAAMVARGVSPIDPPVDALIRWGAAYGPDITHGQWWRLLTSMFLHIGVIHLAMNMFVLWGIGRVTEQLFGVLGCLVLYFATGVASALLSVAWHPMTASAGASGAIFGLYGGFLAYLIRNRRVISPDVLKAQAQNAFIFLGMNAVYGFSDQRIDLAGHAGGLLAGLPIGAVLVMPGGTPAAAKVVKSAVVAVCCAALAGVAGSRMPVVDDWAAEFTRLASLDTKSAETFDGWLQKVRSRAMSPDELGQSVERALLPPWNAERAAMGGLRVPERERRLAQMLVEYMDLQADFWRLTVRGIRSGDASVGREARAKREEALVALQRALPGKAIDDELAELRAATAAEDAFTSEMKQFSTVEAASLKAAGTAIEEFNAGRMSRDRFADRIEQQVIPPWNAERSRLEALTPPESRRALIGDLVKYMTLRAEAWSLRARGVRSTDKALLAEAQTKDAEIARLLKSISGRKPD